MADYNFSQPVRSINDNKDTGDFLVTQINGGTTPANKAEVNSDTELLVHDADIISGNQLTQIQDADADVMAVNDDGSINVNVVDTQVGDQMHIYGTSASGAIGTPVDVATHTVNTGKVFLIKAISGSASGKAKVQLYVGANVQATGFIAATSGTIEFTFPAPIEVAAATAIKVTITNKDNATQDLYAFINGVEVNA